MKTSQTDREGTAAGPLTAATLFPLKREDVMLLFKLVNEFQEKNIAYRCSQLLPYKSGTANTGGGSCRSGIAWHDCSTVVEIVQLSRNSYRMENRKTIFSNRNEDTWTL
ncbi:MAG: hypothetical protein ACLUVG_21010 [Phocaeicola vulgatus]